MNRVTVPARPAQYLVPMPELTHLRLERPSEGVAVLTLDNPDQRNAMSDQMTDSWVAAVDELAADRALRAVVVTGEGSAFCSGGNTSWIASEPDASVDYLRTRMMAFYRYLQPPAFVNQYAAMPSLHAGWDLLVGMAIFAAATSIVLKVVGCVMPALMAGAVIATANHFVVDVIAGVALVLLGHAVALALERRRIQKGVQPP